MNGFMKNSVDFCLGLFYNNLSNPATTEIQMTDFLTKALALTALAFPIAYALLGFLQV